MQHIQMAPPQAAPWVLVLCIHVQIAGPESGAHESVGTLGIVVGIHGFMASGEVGVSPNEMPLILP